MQTVKVIVEKHPDGYVAYPLGLKGVVVGEGDTCEEALWKPSSSPSTEGIDFENDMHPGRHPKGGVSGCL